MSVRAYKVLEIKTAKEPTFNCWSNQDIFELACKNDQYNDGGILSFEKEAIEEALKDEDYSEENRLILKQMLIDFGDEDYIDYYCY